MDQSIGRVLSTREEGTQHDGESPSSRAPPGASLAIGRIGEAPRPRPRGRRTPQRGVARR